MRSDEFEPQRMSTARGSAFKAVVGAVLVVSAVGFGVFRANRATLDIKRAKLTAQALLEAGREYDRSAAVANSLGKLVGVRELTGIAEAIVDVLAEGEVGRFKEAVDYARRCDEDLDGDFGLVQRVFYTQSVACRRMFKTLGEPAELAEAGMTFTDAAQRMVPTGPPGSKDGPACRTWAIGSVRFEVPKTKKSGAAWDVFDGPPDPSVELKVGAATHQGPKLQDTWSYEWSPSRPITTTPGVKVRLRAVDQDLAEPDAIFGYEAVLPPNLDGSLWSVGTFKLALTCQE